MPRTATAGFKKQDPTLLSTREFRRRSGLTERQVNYMVITGRITPAYKAEGSGDRHRFRPSQADAIRAMTPVLKLGIWPNLAEVERLMLDGIKATWVLLDGTIELAGFGYDQPAIWVPLT